MPPWLGPPLPKFLGIYWPRPPETFLPALHSRKYITGIEEEPPGNELVPTATYANEESWEISWSEEGLPTKIVVSRHAEKT